GILMVLAAATGVVALLMRARAALLIAGVLWLPYFVFHLLFQETATSRYDLPLVPPMAWLATQGLLWLPRLALPLSSRRSREWLAITRRWRETLASNGGSGPNGGETSPMEPGPLWFIA